MAKGKLRLTKLQEIFSGGVAKLTLCVADDGRQLVLRELLPRNIFNWRLHRGFVHGTRIRETLSPHENIVYSVERGYTGVCPHEIIEYVSGANLRRLIQERAPVTRDRSFEILRLAAAGLAHVHRNGLIHLDVKAENFLVQIHEDTVLVKLTDFDLSRPAHNARLRHKSGTEVYMAPEQLRHGIVSPQADIFAFGVMAYDLVTGRMPFQGSTAKERRWRQMSESYTLTPPCKHNPELTPRLEWVILRCLEKDPAKRFPSMPYLHKELSEM